MPLWTVKSEQNRILHANNNIRRSETDYMQYKENTIF